MKIFFWIAVVATFVSMPAFSADAFTCHYLSDTGKKMEFEFDASIPKAIEKSVANASVSEILLSPTSACGVPMNVASSCRISAIHQGDDFNISFRCDTLYGDLFFLKDSGYSEFRCQGDEVTPHYYERKFENCRLNR